ncbi:MAG: serine hydrolase [Owenweeksia sp.]|nr:serine hydrolase [Owenweeksia sp.]
MNGYGQDSAWYWASAGKSLMAFLMGVAQKNGHLNIQDKTSQYLGQGWTSAPLAKENLITIRHQMSMTTGLDYNVPNQNCLEDSCLQYRQDAGTDWYYYNAPYRLTQDVLEAAVAKNLNLHTYQSLNPITGITGVWLARIFYSKARSMARFGLLNLNRGRWAGTPVLDDTIYFKAMTSPSQNLNPAYGYLWWLNGGSSYKQPGSNQVFNGPIIPSAPADLYMAAGANDQRIYIVPSFHLVVVRQGEEAYSSQPALSQFDRELWQLMMQVMCTPVSLHRHKTHARKALHPNPAADYVQLNDIWSDELGLYNAVGQRLKLSKFGNRIPLHHLPAGTYILVDFRNGFSERLEVAR